MIQPLALLPGNRRRKPPGPYVHIGLDPASGRIRHLREELQQRARRAGTQGERIRIEGSCLSTASGSQMRDALLEIWQANAAGKYNHPSDQQDKPLDDGFRGWGRTGTDFKTGLYTFETIKPGAVVGRARHRPMAPHVNFWIVARGINIGLNTRMYFADEEEANAQDPVLNTDRAARSAAQTLIAPTRDARWHARLYVRHPSAGRGERPCSSTCSADDHRSEAVAAHGGD